MFSSNLYVFIIASYEDDKIVRYVDGPVFCLSRTRAAVRQLRPLQDCRVWFAPQVRSPLNNIPIISNNELIRIQIDENSEYT